MSSSAPQVATEEKLRANAYRISLTTSIVLALATIASVVLVFQSDIRGISGAIVTGVITLLSVASVILNRRGRYATGIWLLLSGLLIAPIILILVTDNQSIAISIIASIIVSAISSIALPQKQAVRAVTASILIGILAVLIDLLTPNLFNLPSVSLYTNALAVTLSFFYGFILLRQFPTFSLRTKLILSFVIVTAIPLVVLGFRSYQNTQNILIEHLNKDLLETSQATANRLDNFFQNQIDAIRTEAQIEDLVAFMQMPENIRKGSSVESRAMRVLSALRRKNPIFISSYALLNAKGMDVLDTVAEEIGNNRSTADYFVQPFTTGQAYISPIQISPIQIASTSNVPSIYFSAPVRNGQGEIIGVLRVRYNAAYIQTIVLQSAQNAQEKEYTVLVDAENYIRLAHTLDTTLIFKTLRNYTTAEIARLQINLRLPPGDPASFIAANQETINALQNIDTSPVFTAGSVALSQEVVYTGTARIKAMPWIVMNRRSASVVLEPINNQVRSITFLAIGMVALASLGGAIMAQFLSSPLIALAQAARQIEAGDLNVQATVNSRDEFGDLAHSFNSMTAKLQENLEGLEQRVIERTTEVEIARAQSEKRALELQSISEISKVITTEQNLDKLLLLISELVSEKFSFYHVGIFLIDNFRRFAVLQAANSEGGKRMLRRGHRLEVGQTGIVGHVAQSGKFRIALDVGIDAIFFNNPDLPTTRSEMALPLNIRGETIGVLDVQSVHPNAFAQRDANTLGVLADQIAIAIENARLFGQTQQALSEAQSLYGQYLKEEWARSYRTEKEIGYYLSLVGGRIISAGMDSTEIREAVETGDAVVVSADKDDDDQEAVIALPIKLRNQIIGVINIKSPNKGRIWSRDEVDMLRSISDRLALTLETARLFSEARQRADQERSISEISNKIIASTEIEDIMRTAVSELQRLLGASEVFVKMENPEETVVNQ